MLGGLRGLGGLGGLGAWGVWGVWEVGMESFFGAQGVEGRPTSQALRTWGCVGLGLGVGRA